MNVAYLVLDIDGAMYMLDMLCCVHMVLWHVGYAVLCKDDGMYKLDM